MASDIIATLNDPVGSLLDETRTLQTVEAQAFAKAWLLRSMKSDLHRHSMEDAFVDINSVQFKAVVEALDILTTSSDWISPKLEQCLIALKEATLLPQLPYNTRKVTLQRSGRKKVKVIERQSETRANFWISSTSAPRVLILDETIASPEECKSVSDAFTEVLLRLKATCGVNRLCFIEKDMGPVGALSMMSSLVISTKLKACIYRETHWAPGLAMTGDKPNAGDKIAIVYDLVVSGAGIKRVADSIKADYNADTVAAVVLCGYGERRSQLTTDLNPNISLEALEWRADVHGPAFEPSSAPDQSEPSITSSKARKQSGESEQMKYAEDHASGSRVPPGTYTKDNLPPISQSARQIVDAIREGAQNEILSRNSTVRVGGNGLLRLKQRPLKSLKVKLR